MPPLVEEEICTPKEVEICKEATEIETCNEVIDKVPETVCTTVDVPKCDIVQDEKCSPVYETICNPVTTKACR